MINLDEILEKLQSDLEGAIPALLTAAGLADFSEYVIGPSRKERESSLLIYVDALTQNGMQNRLALLFQLQLYAVKLIDASKYAQVVKDYLLEYDWSGIGMTYCDELNIDVWPIERDRTTFVYIDAAIVEPLDSCDEGV